MRDDVILNFDWDDDKEGVVSQRRQLTFLAVARAMLGSPLTIRVDRAHSTPQQVRYQATCMYGGVKLLISYTWLDHRTVKIITVFRVNEHDKRYP